MESNYPPGIDGNHPHIAGDDDHDLEPSDWEIHNDHAPIRDREFARAYIRSALKQPDDHKGQNIDTHG